MPEIVGDLLSQIMPAIEIGVNIEREITHYGKTLSLYEVTPAGETEIFLAEENWTMRRASKQNLSEFPDYPFEFEIVDSDDLTDVIKRTSAVCKLTNDSSGVVETFKIKPPQSVSGSTGLWKFRGQRI